MLTRVIKSRLVILIGIQENNNEFLKKILKDIEKGKNVWHRIMKDYFKIVDLTEKELLNMDKEDIHKHMRKWDTKKWEKELHQKKTLKMYRGEKKVQDTKTDIGMTGVPSTWRMREQNL